MDKYALLFTAHRYVTLEQCMTLTEQDLSAMGTDDDYDKQNLLNLAGRLEGRGEGAAVEELLVSIPHTLSYPSTCPVIPDK